MSTTDTSRRRHFIRDVLVFHHSKLSWCYKILLWIGLCLFYYRSQHRDKMAKPLISHKPASDIALISIVAIVYIAKCKSFVSLTYTSHFQYGILQMSGSAYPISGRSYKRQSWSSGFDRIFTEACVLVFIGWKFLRALNPDLKIRSF